MLRIRVLHVVSGFPVPAAVVDIRHLLPTASTESPGTPTDSPSTPTEFRRAQATDPDGYRSTPAENRSTQATNPGRYAEARTTPIEMRSTQATSADGHPESPSTPAEMGAQANNRDGHPESRNTPAEMGAQANNRDGHPELRNTPAELRGAQVTDPDGYAEFRTVHPGRVPGEPVQINTAVHVGGILAGGRAMTYAGPLIVPEQIAGQVAQGPAPTDEPHPISGGMLTVVPRDRFDVSAGLLATITIAVGD